MKNLSTLADKIFDNATTFTIEKQDQWDNKILMKSWFESNKGLRNKYTTQAPGWYWIGANITFKELMTLTAYDDYHKKSGCVIEEVATNNLKIFDKQFICKEKENGFRILYNGHQGKVLQRLRQHFYLQNENTGALGLNAYPLHSYTWQVWYFSAKHLNRLPSEIQNTVSHLIKNSIGRVAIETAWRAKHGWPTLCKA